MLANEIKNILSNAFAPDRLEIIDDSAAHAGHYSAQSGGHFFVTISSSAFEGKSLVQRHQMIYQALGDMMKQQIHALSINALTPSEDNI